MPGYEGARCEVNLDVCQGQGHSKVMCQNGGTCIDGAIGLQYTCQCVPGYSGELV